MSEHEIGLSRARESLEGLSVGDALGEALSYQCYRVRELDDFSNFRPGSLRYTDDTEMALAIFEVLQRQRDIEEDVLAWCFARRYQRDPHRGYGRMAREILSEVATGADWRSVSEGAFGGGSFGNGASMRVAPLGAYFADQIERVPEAATRSARVTHFHPEGIAGAIAVAVAAAVAVRERETPVAQAAERIWASVLELTPGGLVRDGLLRASQMGDAHVDEAGRELGTGMEISAQDTVPFCIWNACRSLDDYREAFFGAVEVGGDCDTNAAIVGGIVASYTGGVGIPVDWWRVREILGFR